MKTKTGRESSKHSLLLEELANTYASLPSNTQLPSERQLAEQYKVSRMTLRHAIGVLQARGYFYTIASKGVFVAEPKLVRTTDVTSLSEVLRHRGDNATTFLHLADRVQATQEISEALSIRKGEWVYRVEQTYFDSGIAMATETAYVPAKIAPGLLEQDLSQSLSTILTENYERPILRVQYRVRAVIPPKKFQERLELHSPAAVLEFHAIGITQKEHSGFLVIAYKRGDKYDLTYQLEV